MAEEEFYIVGKSPILGPPATKRKFQPGEFVTFDDFTGCEDQFRALAVSGGIKLGTPHTEEMAKRIRDRHDREAR